nr:hypothetical protein [Tanacetum cinerariifolium]
MDVAYLEMNSGKNLEEDTIGDESDLVGGLTDSKYEEINVPIKMGVDCSITAKDLAVGDILAKYGSDVCNASNSFTFPAQ